jgi:predicted ATP-binding protein involved in virulence
MKIQKLELQNFRCFEHKEFDFPNQFTVIIGNNGTGKTAIIRALVISVNMLFRVWKLDNVNSKDYNPEKDDVRHIKYFKHETSLFEPQLPFNVHCEGCIDHYQFSWDSKISDLNYFNTNYTQKEIFSPGKSPLLLKAILDDIAKDVRAGEDVVLPLVALYGTNRLWTAKSQDAIQTIKPGSRMRGYTDCLNSDSNLKGLLAWFKTMELASLQKGKSLAVLDAVKAAIINCIEECESVQYDILEDQLMVKLKNNSELPLKMLSDGFRTMLVMVADIAYRAAVLNPHFGKEAAQKTPGVVLIDEIDLHLHPLWQRRVVEDLKRTFPQIQFIATTHSPFIIQSLRPDELINLDNRDGEYYNKSIEDIAEDVMGVELPQQSERWKKMMQAAEKYYQVLEQAKNASEAEIEKLKEKLDELSMPYSDDPAYQGFLKMERLARGL